MMKIFIPMTASYTYGTMMIIIDYIRAAEILSETNEQTDKAILGVGYCPTPRIASSVTLLVCEEISVASNG